MNSTGGVFPKRLVLAFVTLAATPANRGQEIAITHVAALQADGMTRATRFVGARLLSVKAAMQHREAQMYVTQGLRKNAAIELYLAGRDDDVVKAATGRSGVEMLKKHGGRVRPKVLAMRVQDARDRMEQNKPGP